MRFHHQLTIALVSVASSLALASLSARADEPRPGRRVPIRDSQVMSAAGYDDGQNVGYGHYETDGRDAGQAIMPISAELAQAGVPEGYPVEPLTGEAGAYGDPAMYGDPGMMPPGAPPSSMQPWPRISPFDHRFDQHTNEDGLWMNYTNDGPRVWHGGVEFLWVGLQKISSDQQRIGHPFFRNSFTERLQRDLSPFSDNLSTAGIRPYLSFTDPDDSGAEVSAFWTGSPDENNLYAPEPLFPGASSAIAGNSAIPGMLPIEIARIDQERNVQGSSLYFNQALLAEVGAQSWGADATLITTPFLGRGSNKVRMTYGVRYLDVRENLVLVGYDTVNGRSRIESIVRSRLFGPQVGARWDLGGERLKLITQVKAGAMANFEKLVLNADNYGYDAVGLQRLSRESEENRKLAPLLEFGFTAEMPLFSYLPVLKKTPILKDGTFRIGYTYTAVFNMQRPSGIITYADPLPRIDSDPTKWAIQWVNMGIDWKW